MNRKKERLVAIVYPPPWPSALSLLCPAERQINSMTSTSGRKNVVVLNSNYSYVAPFHGPPSLDHSVGFVITIEA
jgi:hypothetical protein